MKKISLLSIIFTILISSSSFAKTIKVSNTLDFLNAIGSNRTIILSEGVYNISEVIDQVTNENITWLDNFDGQAPIINNISNFAIYGKGDVTIMIEPRYAWVLSFASCSDFTIRGITFGHTEAGYCQGGVLGFEDCNDIALVKCSLYGSGTVGVMTSNCNHFFMVSSDIHECTYGLAYLYDSNDVIFKKTSFRKTGEYNLIEIYNCQEVEFNKCSFSENFNGDFMPYLFAIDENSFSEYINRDIANPESGMVSLNKCTFTNNKVRDFTNYRDKLDLKKPTFSDNMFETPEF